MNWRVNMNNNETITEAAAHATAKCIVELNKGEK